MQQSIGSREFQATQTAGRGFQQGKTELVTCATFNYRDRLTLLLASHQATNAWVPMHVHAIGWPEPALASARKAYPAADFHPHPALTTMADETSRDKWNRSSSVLKLKIELFHETHRRHDGPVIWVDADTLLLKPVKSLVDRVAQRGDFGVTYRSGKKPHARFAVAILCFLQTPAATRLIDDYAAATRNTSGLAKQAEMPWFHDQLALWEVYNSIRPSIFKPMRWQRNAPRLVPLTDNEHSIFGSTDAMFVSRRHGILETPRMREVLQERGIKIIPIHPADES